MSFEEHIKFEHNMWNYLYFIVLVRVKARRTARAEESCVAQMIKVRAWGRGHGDGYGPLFRGSRWRVAAGAGSSGAPNPAVLQRGSLWKKPPEGAGGVWGPVDAGAERPCLWAALWPFLRAFSVGGEREVGFLKPGWSQAERAPG